MTGYSALCGEMLPRRSSSRRAALSASSGSASSSIFCAELVDLRLLLVGLAELLLDGAQLLAQEVLALALVDLAAHVALDLGAELQDVELAREDADELAHALLDVVLLEQRLLVLRLDAHGAGDEEGERPRLLDVGRGHLELFGQVRHERDDLAEHAEQARAQSVRSRATPRSTSSIFSVRAARYGSSLTYSLTRTRCRPCTRMRIVPSGSLIILCASPTVPTG